MGTLPIERIPSTRLQRAKQRASALLPWAALLIPSIVYRLPPLANADGTNADAAICGLQAIHIVRGQLSLFLHGSGYQTSVDSFIAALFFLPFGPSGLALMLSTLTGHLVLTGLAFSVLRRHLPTWTAVLATLPLVFTPGPLHTYILYPPRQASLTLAMAAFFAVEVAGGSLTRLAVGAALGGVACFADPYAMIFLPILGLHALLVARDSAPAPPDRTTFLRRVGAIAGGGLAGLVPFRLLTHSAGASRGPMTLTATVVRRNAKLLWEDALPCLFGTKVYFETHGSDWGPWHPPMAVRALELVGAASFVGALVFGAAAFPMSKRLPWGARRLGLVGALMAPVAVGGFLVSPMVMDFFSTRYLAALTLLSPFALVPAARLLGTRRFALSIAPYLASAALAGWVHYGSDVQGAHLASRAAMANDEHRLGKLLREKGIHYATADYWVTYRLSLLYREDPAFVPTNPAEDRYKPHRDGFEAAQRVAYVYDARRSREEKGSVEARVRRGDTGFERDCEHLEAGEFTIVLLTRRPGVAPAHREL